MLEYAILVRGNSYTYSHKMKLVKIQKETKCYYIIDNIKYRKVNNNDLKAIAFKKSMSNYFSDDLLYAPDNEEIIKIHIDYCYNQFKDKMLNDINKKINKINFQDLYEVWRMINEKRN